MENKEKILYLECYSGISGDMTAGALLDLGADKERLLRALESLHVGGYHLHFGRAAKCGIDAYDFDVHLEEEYGHGHGEGAGDHAHGHGEGEAEHVHHEAGPEGHYHPHGAEAHCGHVHEERAEHHPHPHGESVSENVHHEAEPEGHHHPHEAEMCCGHVHEGGAEYHTHVHEGGPEHHPHPHSEGTPGHVHHGPHHHPHTHRNLYDIYAIIDRMEEKPSVKETAKRMFDIVARAESKAHGLPIEQVHFHEVGAIDSIVDIISAAVLVDSLGVDRVVVSPLSEGRGFVRCQHGVMPVPVPATANIAAEHGLTLRLTDNEGEMVTPTGAAIAAALDSGQGLPARYTIKKVGIGAGKKDFKNANILRAMILEASEEEGDSLWVLETNVDDCTGEALGFAMELLMKAGAKDVWHTPIYMKKNRPAYQLSVLCGKKEIGAMEEILFMNTTTIGIRRYPVGRTAMERSIQEVDTPWGRAAVKVCSRNGIRKVYPEFDSVSRICREHGLAFDEVYKRVQRLGEEREQ